VPSFQDIPQFPRARFEIDVEWRELERVLAGWRTMYIVDLEPDFQRGHVWTEEQQVKYVEYRLRGGETGDLILWASTDWEETPPHVDLLDGLQRLTAVRRFLRDEIPVFGHHRSAWTGTLRLYHNFRFRIVETAARAELLALYLTLNDGGSVHTSEELARVRAMINEARRP